MAPPIEISIPTTSVNSPPDSKPFTQYNITLRLPLRSYVVQKRYSDFAALHDELVRTVGAAPPLPLPGKHWFKSTLSSPELTEDRRRGLEAYLRAIAEEPDRRWRDTPAWRHFMNLPPAGGGGASAASSSGVGVEGRVPAINLHGPNAAAASDPTTWTDLHREMKGHLHEARLQLARRDAANDSGAGSGPGTGGKHGSTAAVEAGASAKRALVRAGSLLAALEGGLRAMRETKRLGEGELRRRRDLLAAARAERDGLDKLSSSLASARGVREGAPSSGDKATLLSGAGGSSSSSSSSRARTGGRVLGAPLPETERSRELDNVGVVQLQRQQMQEQDQDVEELAKIIRRQKEMGLAIKSEVEVQNEMLDQMDRDVDRVEAKMKVANSKARKLGS